MGELRVVREFREQLLAADPDREHARRRRRWAVRHPLLAAAAGLLLAGGIATAATGEFPVGDPLPDLADPVEGRAPLGAAVDDSGRIETIRAEEPTGGPPWGVRVLRTEHGGYCEQIGRVVDGRLGVIGDDGAFHEAPSAINSCFGSNHGQPSSSSREIGLVSTSGFVGSVDGAPQGGYGPAPCNSTFSAKDSFDAQAVVICDDRPRRNLATGIVDPSVVSVEIESGGTVTRHPVVDGRYLVVFTEDALSRERTAYVVFDDGRRQRAWTIEGEPVHEADGTSASASKADLRAADDEVGMQDQVVVKVRAPQDADPSTGGWYWFRLTGPAGCAHQAQVPFVVQTGTNVRAGDLVRFALRPPGRDGNAPRAWCPGRYTGAGVYRDRLPIGRFTFNVRAR